MMEESVNFDVSMNNFFLNSNSKSCWFLSGFNVFLPVDVDFFENYLEVFDEQLLTISNIQGKLPIGFLLINSTHVKDLVLASTQKLREASIFLEFFEMFNISIYQSNYNYCMSCSQDPKTITMYEIDIMNILLKIYLIQVKTGDW